MVSVLEFFNTSPKLDTFLLKTLVAGVGSQCFHLYVFRLFLL